MLPKLQNLRDNAKCIFIIAASYAERIDPAIVRAGRVDVKIPLMPPSWAMRRAICVEKFDKDKLGERYDEYCSEIATRTKFFTWKELNNLLRRFPSDKPIDNLGSFIKDNGSATLSLKKVSQRLPKPNNGETIETDRQDIMSVAEEIALLYISIEKETDAEKFSLEIDLPYKAKLETKIKEIINDLLNKVTDENSTK